MVAQGEPAAVYRCHHGTPGEVTPGGALQTEHGWNTVFGIAVPPGAMLPLHIWNSKVYWHCMLASLAAVLQRSLEVPRQTSLFQMCITPGTKCPARCMGIDFFRCSSLAMAVGIICPVISCLGLHTVGTKLSRATLRPRDSIITHAHGLAGSTVRS